jgi:hypothetical protein
MNVVIAGSAATDLPDGQISDVAVQPLRKKYPALRLTQITGLF